MNADDEKTEQPENTAESQTDTTPDSGEGAEDYEQKYRDLQGKYEEAEAKRREAETTLELVQPYVNFGDADKPAQETREEGDAEAPQLTKEDLDKGLSAVQNNVLALQFRVDHPELRGYEETLVGPQILHLRNKHPQWPADKLLNEAASRVNTLLKAEHEKTAKQLAAEKAAKEEKDRKAAEAAAFGSRANTSPTQEEEGEDAQAYLSTRLKGLAKKKNQV